MDIRRTTLVVLIAIFSVALGGCSTNQNNPAGETVQNITHDSPRGVTMSDDVARKWARSCALCHINGTAGAPVSGVASDWAPRLTKGKGLLMKHTIDGFNSMPPLGYCMACEAADFSAMIDFMSGVAK